VLVEEAQQEFSYTDRDSAIKPPIVFSRVLDGARQKGKPCKTLEAIVMQILKLRG
jgi:hypothetical protein